METWCTFDEIDFVEKIGSFYFGPVGQTEESPEERHFRLLKKYRDAIRFRKDWGSMDRDDILRIVDKDLDEQEGGLERTFRETRNALSIQ